MRICYHRQAGAFTIDIYCQMVHLFIIKSQTLECYNFAHNHTSHWKLTAFKVVSILFIIWSIKQHNDRVNFNNKFILQKFKSVHSIQWQNITPNSLSKSLKCSKCSFPISLQIQRCSRGLKLANCDAMHVFPGW